MKKWKVYGRITAHISFQEEVEASTENSAVKKAEKIIKDRCRIDDHSIFDDEIYAERIKP